jgi:hypothetical protein
LYQICGHFFGEGTKFDQLFVQSLSFLNLRMDTSDPSTADGWHHRVKSFTRPSINGRQHKGYFHRPGIPPTRSYR